jgi:hypothetical protein
MKTANSEPQHFGYTILVVLPTKIWSIITKNLQSKTKHWVERDILDEETLSGQKKRTVSKYDYASTIDQLAKFRAGIY